MSTHHSFHEFSLDNGVRVVFLHYPGMYGAEISIRFLGGHLAELEAERGNLHLLEHLFHQGNATYKTLKDMEYAKERIGMSTSGAYVGPLYMGIDTQIPGENLHAGLSYLADFFTQPTPSIESIDRERQIIHHEYNDQFSNPAQRFYSQVHGQYYGKNHPYGWYTALGTPDHIDRLNSDSVLNIYSRLITGSNLVIGIAGDFDVSHVKDCVSTYFGQMPQGETSFIMHPKAGHDTTPLTVHEHVSQAEIIWYVPGVGYADCELKTELVNSLIDYLLGRSPHSQFFNILRVSKQLAYQFSVRSTMWPHDGHRMIWIPTHPSLVDQVQHTVYEIIDQFIQTGIDPELFTLMKQQYHFSTLKENDNYHSLLYSALKDVTELNKIITNQEKVTQVDQLTLEECNAAIESGWGNIRQGLCAKLLPIGNL